MISKRTWAWVTITIIMFAILLYQLPGKLAQLDQSAKELDEAKHTQELAKQRLDEASANTEYWRTHQ
jgi:hypothetical protein